MVYFESGKMRLLNFQRPHFDQKALYNVKDVTKIVVWSSNLIILLINTIYTV